jgi:hypothetical protein
MNIKQLTFQPSSQKYCTLKQNKDRKNWWLTKEFKTNNGKQNNKILNDPFYIIQFCNEIHLLGVNPIKLIMLLNYTNNDFYVISANVNSDNTFTYLPTCLCCETVCIWNKIDKSICEHFYSIESRKKKSSNNYHQIYFLFLCRDR